LENIFNLEMLETMNKMHQIEAKYERSPGKYKLKKGHHQNSSLFCK